MKKLLLLLLLIYPLSAVAEMYEWTDAQGTVNFTEDLGKVPKKYRKKAKRLGSEEPPAESAPPVAAPETSKPKGVEEKGAKAKAYGGKDELTWRREFLQANSSLQSAQTELDTLKTRLSDTSRMSRSEYLIIQNSIKHSEIRVQELQKKLDQLNSSADRHDVPAEFRK